MAADDTYEVQVHYQIGSQPTMNVFHMKEVDSSSDDRPAEAVCDIVHTLWDTLIMPHLSEDVTVPVIKARRVLPTQGNSSTLVPGGAEYNALIGGEASEPLSSQVAALVTLLTATEGKRGQGRMYIPGMPESAASGGRFTIAAYGDLSGDTDLLDGIKTPAAGFTGTWRLAVLSRVDSAARSVVKVYLQTSLATQRGRRQHPGFAA